ncbi:Biotin carboxyl carrier protein of acetyl-CoA carboxylase [bacterium HR21]|nr:Biotin carboxyl carrier protein of acetyl-CoA carboxylase [bacterium HR21]
MDLTYLRRLLRIFDESSASELIIEEEGVKLRIVKHQHNTHSETTAPVLVPMPMPSYVPVPPTMAPLPSTGAPAPAPSAPPVETPAPPPPHEEVVEKKLHEIRSPIVGTFYRAPAPDAEPFVQLGSHVTPGTTLCIIEAMKLMNEIQSDVAGTVVKICVENGQPVEYNQLLFLIEPDAAGG